MHPNQMKGAKAKSKAKKNLPSVAPLSFLGRCVLPRLRGFFFLLFFFPPSLVSPSYMQPALGTGSQEGSIGTLSPPRNQLYSLSEKPSFLRTLSFKWFRYSVMNCRSQMRAGEVWGEGWKKAGYWGEKIHEEFFAFSPWGRGVCWWNAAHFP